MKPRLKILVGQAGHFLRWEQPIFENRFHMVESPGNNVNLLVFGPDMLMEGAHLPALKRIAYLFPGFGQNPYHNLELRSQAMSVIDEYYDLVLVNPGPVHEAYRSSPKVVACPFSIDVGLVNWLGERQTLNSLLHVSIPTPQKDWERSAQIIRKTGLRGEVFPPRDKEYMPRHALRRQRWNRRMKQWHIPYKFKVSLLEECGYVDHSVIVNKYHAYDGFVHVASEQPDMLFVDGKYTACLLEAGLTGAILFWHDTLGLGNDLETVFDLPAEPDLAATMILDIRSSLNIREHSKRTREEILERFSPEKSVGYRCDKIEEILK